MAGVRQGRSHEEESASGGRTEPGAAVRIDTDVFATLTATDGDSGDSGPKIARWLDCWRR